MEYKLIRSRRKTVTLRVLPGGVLEVRAPLRLPRREIDRIVGRHADWAQRAIAAAPPVPSPLREGALLPFLGKEYPIALREGEPAGIREGKFCLPLPRSAGEKEIKDAAEKFYRAAARELLPPKLERYAALFGTDWTGLRITSARTRWGSCSANPAGSAGKHKRKEVSLCSTHPAQTACTSPFSAAPTAANPPC